MLVKITCACSASFEIKDGSRHPKTIACPNCGRVLPNDASQNLYDALASFSLFEAKLDDSGLYDIFVSK